jgi:hypothetical protein
MARNTPAVPATDAEIRAAYNDGSYVPTSDAFLPALAGGTYSKTKGYIPSESGLVRGRLSAAVREDFTAQTKRPTRGEFAKGERRPSDKTVEVPMVSAKTGRPIKPRVLPLDEARALAGTEGKKGKMSAADLAKVAVALGGAAPQA